MKALIKGILFAVVLLFIYNLYNKSINTKPVFLANTYKQAHKLYSLKYPDDWIYTNTDKESVIFSGPKGSKAFFTLVKIELLTADDLGSEGVTAGDLVRDYTEQLGKHGTVLSFGNVTLPSDHRFTGMYVTASYHYKGEMFKKTQYFMAKSTSKNEFYLWSYTALEDYYKLSLPIANAMFKSWVIHGN